MSILRMHLLGSEEINENPSDLPPQAFALISTSKLREIDF